MTPEDIQVENTRPVGQYVPRVQNLPPSLSRDLITAAEFFMATMAHEPFSTNSKELRISEPLGTDEKGEPMLRSWALRIEDPETGFPIAGDQDLQVSIMYHAQRTRFQERFLRLTRADLCATLGWRPNIQRYHQIVDGLHRCRNVTYRGENTFFDRHDGQRRDIIEFGFVDAFSFSDKPPKKTVGGTQHELPLNYIRLSDEFLVLCRQAQLKMIDLDFYRSLSRPEVRWLYRFLDKNLYKKRQYRIGLRKLRRRQGLLDPIEDKYIKRKHQPRFQELTERGFLKGFDFIKAGSAEDPWQVVVWPGRQFFASKAKRAKAVSTPPVEENEPAEAQNEPNTAPSEPTSKQAEELLCYWRKRRGFPVDSPIRKSDRQKALSLLNQFQGNVDLAQRVVQEAIDDWPKMKNFAGVLANDYPERVRKSYLDDQRARQQRQAEDERRREQDARDERERREARERWDALAEEERQRLVDEAEAELRERHPSESARMTPEVRRRTAEHQARGKLRPRH